MQELSQLSQLGGKLKRKGRGGSILADASVPAGLLLLQQYLKKRTKGKKSMKKSKVGKTKVRKSMRRKSMRRKSMRKRR